jgi:hypothetical protein
MSSLVKAIVSAIQASLVSDTTALQQTLDLEAVPVQIVGNTVTFTVPKSQKLGGLLAQPNHIMVPETERKNKDGTTVRVRSYKRKTSKPTLEQAIKADEADEVDTQQATDAVSEFITNRIQQGLSNLKSASL